MRARAFTVPFSRLGSFPELEFGPDETITLHPLESCDAQTVETLRGRLYNPALEGSKDPDPKVRQVTEDLSDQLIVDLLDLCVVEWTLKGPDSRAIPVPKTSAALRSLPHGLAGAFFDFLISYRGEEPNPTTGS